MEIRKLNALRGLAALIVVLSHYSNFTKLQDGVLGFGAGQFGVMLFFILSGFLMSYLYVGKEPNGGEIYMYAIARVARVVPLFLVVVLASYAFHEPGVWGVLYPIPDELVLISHLSFLSGVSVLWTIPVEIQFYFLFVFMWWVWRKPYGLIYFSIILIALVWLHTNYAIIKGLVYGVPYESKLLLVLPYFMAGVFMGRLYAGWVVPSRLKSHYFVLALLFIPLLYPKVFSLLMGYEHMMWRDVTVLSAMSLIFFITTFLVPDDNVFLCNRVGDFLGKISYSLYLLHLPVLFLFKDMAKASPTGFLPVYLATAIGTAYVSYLLIEKPARGTIRSLAFRKREQAPSRQAPIKDGIA